MNVKLPILSGRQVVKTPGKINYTVNDQKGSHIHLRHPIKKPLTVPDHTEIARGTLRESSSKMLILLLKEFWSFYRAHKDKSVKD